MFREITWLLNLNATEDLVLGEDKCRNRSEKKIGFVIKRKFPKTLRGHTIVKLQKV